MTQPARNLVIAAHPDDDVIGCGAMLAAAFRRRDDVRIVYVTDGSASHPGSRHWSPQRLAALRESEAAEAIERLGGVPSILRFLRVTDGTVSVLARSEREHVVAEIRSLIVEWKPSVVFSHWRRDPHPDHRAVSGIVRDAVCSASLEVRLLEYPVWLAIRGSADDAPALYNVRGVTFETDGNAQGRKREALLAHRSQTTQLIDDDPDGFVMSADLIERFCSNTEIFYEDAE